MLRLAAVPSRLCESRSCSTAAAASAARRLGAPPMVGCVRFSHRMSAGGLGSRGVQRGSRGHRRQVTTGMSQCECEYFCGHAKSAHALGHPRCMAFCA
eukprot:2597537-Pyramimonas_sp.AAC.1